MCRNKRQRLCPAAFRAKAEGQGERAAGPTSDGALQGPWLVCTDHEAHKQGWKILHLVHSTAGARKRTYSLYEQPKSKIKDAETVTKNSPASEAAVSSPGQLSPASGITESRAAGKMAFRVYSGID